ncbi:hypothetical protein ONE63_005023 [Megalurothrips usitatus]|uniref:DDE Tnp4 domain-containing protein n=1 Tax=Megalurothrips usitatus TaxID=439358 RepID=A0AAV7X535_9NEOP|nr:hypothetical protein ONE63_005023 [Megalurothrips usitatus]
MVDRGFDVETECRARGVRILMPPFKTPNQTKFTSIQVLNTRKLARARIHVERRIGRVRDWTFLNNVIPQTLLPVLSQQVYVCAALSNYQFFDL